MGVSPDSYLQLDDAVIVDTEVPGRGTVRIAGIVQDARARHEGASFDTDVFLVDQGILPVERPPRPRASRHPGPPPAAETMPASHPACVLVSDQASMNCGSNAGTIENPVRLRISAAHMAATTGVEGAAGVD